MRSGAGTGRAARSPSALVGVAPPLGRALTLLALLLAPGCTSTPDEPIVTYTLLDSTGAVFTDRCGWAECTVTPGDPVDACGEGAMVRAEQQLLLCAGAEGLPRPESCRAMACEDDEECSRIFVEPYVCSAGLCEREEQEPDGSVSLEDFYARCLVEVPRSAVCRATDLDGVEAPAGGALVGELVSAHCHGTRCDAVAPECAP